VLCALIFYKSSNAIKKRFSTLLRRALSQNCCLQNAARNNFECVRITFMTVCVLLVYLVAWAQLTLLACTQVCLCRCSTTNVSPQPPQHKFLICYLFLYKITISKLKLKLVLDDKSLYIDKSETSSQITSSFFKIKKLPYILIF
jgi:hypothetical protein